MNKKWPMTRLAELLVHNTSYIGAPEPRLYRKLSVKLYGKGVVLDAPTDGSILKMRRHQIAKAGEVILSEIWGKKGAIGFVPPEGEGALCTSHFFLFDVRPERIDPRYLNLIFRRNYLEEQLNAHARGTTGYAAVRPKHLLSCQIPLPTLDEQRRIVAWTDELAAKIEEARVLRSQSLEEANALYGQKLTQVMNRRGKNWVEETVADVIASMDAGWSPQCDDIPATGQQWGVLKTTAVQWCEFRPNENKMLPGTLEPIPSLAVKRGDVLVTRAGPRKRVGVVAAVRQDEPRLTISDKLIRLRANTDKIDPRFLELCLASPLAQEYLLSRKTGLADAQVNISQAILRSTPVAYPPLHAQRQIVGEFDELQGEVNALRGIQNKTAEELDALLPSILDHAFSGKI